MGGLFSFETIIAFINVSAIAFTIGFLPIFIWLGFWLLQDRKRPEPKKLIGAAFFLGMLAVPFAILFQGIAAQALSIDPRAISLAEPTLLFILFLLWAGAEEVLKILFVSVIILRKTAVDEPIDIPIYFITAALGFAALENTLFLFSTLQDGHLIHSFITGNLRFVGATLIHTLSTAIIAGAVALAFYRGWRTRLVWGFGGLILATLVHALFNFFIVTTRTDLIVIIFAAVWVGIVFFLIGLEYIKRIERPAWWKKIFIRKN